MTNEDHAADENVNFFTFSFCELDRSQSEFNVINRLPEFSIMIYA